MLFSKSAEYYTEFAQVNALEAGAKVRVGGMRAGEIVEIRVPRGPGSKFRLKFKIVEKLFPVIRTDSVASIQSDGLLGNKFLQIEIGTTGLAPSGYVLSSREPFEIGDLLADGLAGIECVQMPERSGIDVETFGCANNGTAAVDTNVTSRRKFRCRELMLSFLSGLRPTRLERDGTPCARGLQKTRPLALMLKARPAPDAQFSGGRR
jgi:hypothetical protein